MSMSGASRRDSRCYFHQDLEAYILSLSLSLKSIATSREFFMEFVVFIQFLSSFIFSIVESLSLILVSVSMDL